MSIVWIFLEAILLSFSDVSLLYSTFIVSAAVFVVAILIKYPEKDKTTTGESYGQEMDQLDEAVNTKRPQLVKKRN